MRLRPTPLPGTFGTLAAVTGLMISIALGAGCASGEVELPGMAGETNPVKGKILLSDGKPLVGATVTFVPSKGNGAEAHGKTTEDGSFDLTTRKAGDGALAGEYGIKIEPAPPASNVKKILPPPIPNEYRDEESSGLTASVKPGPNELDTIQLQAKVKRQGKRASR